VVFCGCKDTATGNFYKVFCENYASLCLLGAGCSKRCPTCRDERFAVRAAK